MGLAPDSATRMILVIATADFFVVLRLRMGIGVVAAAVVALMQLATTMMLQEGLVVKVEMVVAHVADVVVAVVMVPLVLGMMSSESAQHKKCCAVLKTMAINFRDLPPEHLFLALDAGAAPDRTNRDYLLGRC